eukprot:gene41055-50088_t
MFKGDMLAWSCLRWRRLTSLTVETLECRPWRERHTQDLQALEHEAQQMENLANV